MSSGYYIIEKEECDSCSNRGLYNLNDKHPWHCYHPSRSANPAIKERRGKRKPCKLLKGG